MDLRCVFQAVLSTHSRQVLGSIAWWVGYTDADRFSLARSVGGKYRIGKKIGSGSVSLANLYLSPVYTKRN